MRPLVLTGVVALAAGVMNMIPWGGPTVRAMAALDLESSDIFLPVVPAMAVGIIWVLSASYMIGRKERQRLVGEPIVLGEEGGTGPEAGGHSGTRGQGPAPAPEATEGTVLLAEREVIGRGGRWVHAFNVVLTLALVGVLLFQLMPLEVAFVVAFALALAVNLPNWDDQQELFKQHGGNVVLVVSMILLPAY